MSIQITSLRVDYRGEEVPYAIFNCTFRITDDENLWGEAKSASEEYTKNLSVDDPERYEEWVMKSWSMRGYDGFQRVWTLQDPVWQHIEKFDTFWLREWISDCPGTRAIISELEYFREHGKLPTVYRGTDEGTILRHLRTLHSYWD